MIKKLSTVILSAALIAGLSFVLTARGADRADNPPPRDEAPPPGDAPPRRPGGFHLLPPHAEDRLKLTAEQRKQLAELEAEVKPKLDKILTAKQKEQLEQMRPPPPPPEGPDAPDNPGPDRPQRPAPPPPDDKPDATRQTLPPRGAVKGEDRSRVAVTFTAGYETDPADHGRPVVLIAAALNVSADVFRQAFSNVKPASGGQSPQPAQVRLNKETLLKSLGPHGVTNDRLDEVSNYYRYNRGKGEMWRNTPAVAYATIHDGAVTGFTIADPGSGYSSPPRVSIAGMPDLNATVSLSFGTDFKTNGSIKEITLAEGKSAAR